MIIIPDFSHHNTPVALVREWITTFGRPDVIILKATEGKGYQDNQLYNMLDMFCKSDDDYSNVTIGLYHYCRADSKIYTQSAQERAEEEMKWFTDRIKDVGKYIYDKHPYNNVKLVPILDWEGENLKLSYRDIYLCECVGEIYKAFGSAPVIYTSAAYTSSKECLAVKSKFPDVGLWIAHYGVKQPRISNWKEWIAWQFTSTPFDLSFVRNDAFKRYAIK